MQLSAEPTAGLAGPRSRLFELLTPAEREPHRQIQNLVIAKTPFDESRLEALSPLDQAAMLAKHMPRFVPYDPRLDHDVWFRYLDEEDVRRSMRSIADVLPDATSRFLAGTRGDAGGNRRLVVRVTMAHVIAPVGTSPGSPPYAPRCSSAVTAPSATTPASGSRRIPIVVTPRRAATKYASAAATSSSA